MKPTNLLDPADHPALSCEVLHSSFGRLRVHLARWPGSGARALATHLHGVPGVQRAEANALTQNVLLMYDPSRTTAQALLHALPQAVKSAGTTDAPPPAPAEAPDTLRQERIPVHGLDHDPHLGARVVERLHKVLGVRAWVSLLTSQVHVAYDHTRVRAEDIRSLVESLQHPVPGEDRPRHPLDPDPLLDGVMRVVGSVAGMGLLTLQRLIAPQLVPATVLGVAAGAAGVFNLVQGFPVLRDGLRRMLGRRPADVIMVGTGLAALATANIPLGLVAAGLEGFFLAEEVTARRSSYRRYENSIDTGVSALPGAVIRLEAGTRVPRDARIVEGFGTALGTEGQQQVVLPGGHVAGGTLLLGGPFVLELEGAEPGAAPAAAGAPGTIAV